MPHGIETLIGSVAREGTQAYRTMHAEDLAGSDAERRNAMLESQRDSLTALRDRAQNITDLIQISNELNAVQSQIEYLATQRTRMAERVDYEVLNITFDSEASLRTTTSPILQAWRNITPVVSESVAGLITFLARMIPWTAAFLAGLAIARLLVRRRKTSR